MNAIPLLQSLQPGQVVLVLSAHCDDAEIGCGGLLRRLDRELGKKCEKIQVAFSGGDDPNRKQEQLVASRAFGMDRIVVHAYPDSLLPDHWQEIKADLLKLREEVGEDRIGMILCPRLDDRHQDHRVVAENVWRVFRNHLVLEYEIVKYEGDLSTPNVYAGLSESQAREKVNLILNSFPSQAWHHWWNPETFLALMRLRGVECRTEFAEGFVARKLLL
jgi:LmbE family N-acetylglucosaminyl deacetylase